MTLRPVLMPGLLVFGLLALSAAGAGAEESMAGRWTLNLGHRAPCLLTMTDDGTVTPAPDCALGVNLAYWKSTSDGIQLQTASGETYAVLKPKGGDFEGVVFADRRSVTLSR